MDRILWMRHGKPERDSKMRIARFAMYPACVVLLLAASIHSAAGDLRVGASRIEYTKLTPAPATPPSGKYAHEKLFVRAIVIDNGASQAALVSVDGSSGSSTGAKVADLLQCPVESVIASGTHSHSAGLGGPRPKIQSVSPRQGIIGGPPTGPSPVDEVIMEAVRQAAAKLHPARTAFGTGLCYLKRQSRRDQCPNTIMDAGCQLGWSLRQDRRGAHI
jgi:hypothetical protein